MEEDDGGLKLYIVMELCRFVPVQLHRAAALTLAAQTHVAA
jgi:hypothetical protein